MRNKTEIIWKTFNHQLRSFILPRISDPSLADDILQEVFLKIHSKIDTLKDETKIHSWIYQIIRNTIIDYYRKQKTRLEDINSIPLDNYNTFPVIDEITEESPAQEIASGLREMVEALPEKYTQTLLLVEFQGLSQIELAQKLGISVSGAKSRVQRGRHMLRDSLMIRCHFHFDRFGTIIDYHPITCCCCQKSSINQ